MDRNDVLECLDKERDYQIRRWGIKDDQSPLGYVDIQKSVEEYLLYMKVNLDKAMAAIYDNNLASCKAKILNISALGVACMEQHGVLHNRSVYVDNHTEYVMARSASKL